MVNPEDAPNAAIAVPQGGNDALPDNAPLQEALVDFDDELPEIPPAVKLTIKLRSFHKMNPANITDRVLPQTEELWLDMGRQYLEELSSIPSFLKLDIVGMSIKMTIVVQSGNDIQSVPIEVAKFLRQLKAGMVTTKISALEFRLHFCFYGGAPFKPQDRTAVLDHSELQEFNIEEGSFGLFYAMPRATEFFACILSF